MDIATVYFFIGYLLLLVLSSYFKKGEPVSSATINRTFAWNETQVYM